MNDRARDVLRQAWLDGVHQIRLDFQRPVKTLAGRTEMAYCGLGVLGWRNHTEASEGVRLAMDWGLRLHPTPCPVCLEVQPDETSLVGHLNDRHDFDFGKIAELCPGEPPR